MWIVVHGFCDAIDFCNGIFFFKLVRNGGFVFSYGRVVKPSEFKTDEGTCLRATTWSHAQVVKPWLSLPMGCDVI